MKLYIIPTPLGNLEDITLRALRLLKEVDAILCEDTRTTHHLLSHYNIIAKLISFHQHNEHMVLDHIINQLQSGATYALVSDAGMPGISDAGFLLIRKCRELNIPIETLPGATAFLIALINSGFPCDKFYFEGFLPHKKGRQTRLKMLIAETRTVVMYESPHRLIKLLQEISTMDSPTRLVAVSRELTKKFEENFRGTCEEAIVHFENGTLKGEIVVVLQGVE
jgi:16S rRNA (cytidine1402-2'-O)-methyltransferase